MIVETFTFALAPGTDVDDFLGADQRLQTEVAYPQPGIVRRTTARSGRGEWLVLTLWGTQEEAEAGAAAAAAHDAGRAFLALIDPDTARTSRYETLD